MTARSFDVVIAGGGLAGSSLGGVLARAGLGVLVVEKESGFRDRIRGELTWPWGHYEALRAGLGEPLDQVGVVPLPVLDFYQLTFRTSRRAFGPPLQVASLAL